MSSDARTRKNERRTIRKLLLFYDTAVLVLVWAGIFLLHPSQAESLPLPENLLHLGVAFILFTLFRVIFRVYFQVLRTGTVGPFAREMLACVCASAIYLPGMYFLPFAKVPFTTELAFALGYSLICLFLRVAYSYLFRLLRRNTKASLFFRKVLAPLTLVDFDTPDGLMRVVLEPDEASRAPINRIQATAEKFAVRGEVRDIKQITKGYINQTYVIETLSDTGHIHKYLLQRINTDVFRDPDLLMRNYVITTRHLYGRLRLPGLKTGGSVQLLNVTKNGESFLKEDSGCWRMLSFFDDVYSLDIPDSPKTFYWAGRAFGRFVREMADIDASELGTVIPDFHNTKKRYGALEASVDRDPKGRAAQVQKEIAFYRERANSFGVIADALDLGRIPWRICHNDCNLNNILFDKTSHLPAAIIDLDTVMPGSPLYDFGDSIRIGTNTATDDEKDLSRVTFSVDLFEQYAKGYLEEFGSFMTKAELELLPLAPLVITSEDGIRFLADHIDGDTYYNIYYPGQNLDRCRTQLTLLADMERRLPDIVRVLSRIYAENGYDAVLDYDSIDEKWPHGDRPVFG